MGVLIFIIGAVLGSFYLVVATRLPNKEDIIISRSHCDNCKANLKWYQLIPILSYVLFLGKCKKKKKRIPIVNLLVELITGSLFIFLYYNYGFGYEFYAGAIISSLMIIIFISDFKYLIILDSPLVIGSLILLGLKYYYFGFNTLCKSFLAGVILFSVMYLIGLIGNKLFKKESLGGGDIKFAFVIGIVLGFKLGLVALILSSFFALPISIASIYITKNNEVPFGPFLSGGLFVTFIFMTKFVNLLNFIFNV